VRHAHRPKRPPHDYGAAAASTASASSSWPSSWSHSPRTTTTLPRIWCPGPARRRRGSRPIRTHGLARKRRDRRAVFGRIDVAEGRVREQLAICRHERIETLRAEPTLGLAAVAAQVGDAERAATLIGASQAQLPQVIGDADRPVYERLIARFISPARSALSETAWNRAEAAGRTP
jgi:hypothetical protein